MGVIKQGILGGFSGSVANVVGSSWKGIAVIKSKPLSVANPKTTAQTAQRNKLAGAVEAAKDLLAALIQPYWNPFAQGQSGYNRFVSVNIDNFANGVFTDFANFFSMRGALINAPVGTVTADASDSEVVVPWTDNTGTSDGEGTDEAIITYYNETQDYWVVDAGNATRSDATITITDGDMVASDELHVYLSFSRPNISKVSDSLYKAATVTA